MPATTTEQYLIVEQTVETVLGREPAGLEATLARVQAFGSKAEGPAAAASDKGAPVRDPEAMGALLAKHLESSPDDVGALEALAILCLAHPKLARRARFSLVAGGRRLAGLLQREGRAERAQEFLEALAQRAPKDRGVEQDLASVMRRTGNVDVLIERYLARAEEAEASGRRRDAITWLREVLMLDSSRRDVARMIRDLQYETRQTKEARHRRWRGTGLLVVIVALVSAVVLRELYVQDLYASIPPAAGDNRQSVEERLERLDHLIESNPLWLGMFRAGRERADLRVELERIYAEEAELERAKANERAERQLMAETARMRARALVENADYAGAAVELEQALELAAPSWAHRERVQADLQAVRAELERAP